MTSHTVESDEVAAAATVNVPPNGTVVTHGVNDVNVAVNPLADTLKSDRKWSTIRLPLEMYDWSALCTPHSVMVLQSTVTGTHTSATNTSQERNSRRGEGFAGHVNRDLNGT